MKLICEDEVDFLGVENKVSKKTGEPFSLIVIGDSQNYQKYEFFKTDSIDLSLVRPGSKVIVQFQVNRVGFDTKLNLIKMIPA
ncbi:hypothetical protein ABQD64_13715 [Vagococcus fluvialis]|uniref:hypothetical protein n=1 Tax=Vagococcus fluvialis TaxID=2738 RepID=UPI0032E3F9AC